MKMNIKKTFVVKGYSLVGSLGTRRYQAKGFEILGIRYTGCNNFKFWIRIANFLYKESVIMMALSAQDWR